MYLRNLNYLSTSWFIDCVIGPAAKPITLFFQPKRHRL